MKEPTCARCLECGVPLLPWQITFELLLPEFVEPRVPLGGGFVGLEGGVVLVEARVRGRVELDGDAPSCGLLLPPDHVQPVAPTIAAGQKVDSDITKHETAPSLPYYCKILYIIIAAQ